MNWSIRKGEVYVIDEKHRIKLAGATLKHYHITVSFIFYSDIVERVIVRNIDNRDCMYIGNTLHFKDKVIVDKLINEIVNEVT